MYDEKRIPVNASDRVKRGEHKHLCKCGNAWKHSDEMLGDEEAHTCSACGTKQWKKHRTAAECRELEERSERFANMMFRALSC